MDSEIETRGKGVGSTVHDAVALRGEMEST